MCGDYRLEILARFDGDIVVFPVECVAHYDKVCGVLLLGVFYPAADVFYGCGHSSCSLSEFSGSRRWSKQFPASCPVSGGTVDLAYSGTCQLFAAIMAIRRSLPYFSASSWRVRWSCLCISCWSGVLILRMMV